MNPIGYDHRAAELLELARIEPGGDINLDLSERVTRHQAVARLGEPEGRGWGGEYWRHPSGAVWVLAHSVDPDAGGPLGPPRFERMRYSNHDFDQVAYRARERALAAGRSGGRRAVGRPNAEDYKLAQAEWDAFAR